MYDGRAAGAAHRMADVDADALARGERLGGREDHAALGAQRPERAVVAAAARADDGEPVELVRRRRRRA